MRLLSEVKSGIDKKPPFLLVYGLPKIGKTTFATQGPSPLVIDIEQGSHLINTKRLIPKNYQDVTQALQELISEKHEYKTLVLDSLDHLEPWIWSAVCKRENKKTIEEVGGGYQKGYIEALKEWNEVITLLKRCRDERDMIIVCIAHVHVKATNDPTQIASYDRFELKFHPKASALFKENSDAILFARQEILVAGGDAKKKGKAVGEGRRVLYTQGMPGYEAGNRYNLPGEMEFDFKQVYALIQNEAPPNPEQMIMRIKGFASVLESDLKEKVLTATEKAGTDLVKLNKIYKQLVELGSK